MKYCVIGEKLTHSMSPQIHKRYFDYYKQDSTYEITQIPMEDMLGDCSGLLKEYDGFNVTVPYKEKVLKYLQGTSDEAKEIGAVNTVVNQGGDMYGFNTDPFGFESLLIHNDVAIKDKVFVVLGSGGASKSVCYILKKRGAKKVIVVTRKDTSEEGYMTYSALESFKGDVLVNTTPVGMYPNVDNCPVNENVIANFDTVVDIVYNPVYTELLKAAVRLGKKAVGGLYMLVAQAMKSQEIWQKKITDKELYVDIYNALMKEYFQKNGGNIYLTGIMSCGKTVKGKRVARTLGWEFIDADEYIEKISGRTVKQLFAEGEHVFRKWESKAMYELSLRKNIVVATGGGAILKDENVSAMKLSGIIVLIERNIEDILNGINTDTRPLLKDGKERCGKELRVRYLQDRKRYCQRN